MATVRWDDDEGQPGERDAARRALADTRALLRQASAAWARSSCPASGDCCQLSRTGRSPSLWPSEWRVIEAALAAQGRVVPSPRSDGACPFLVERRCSIYEVRPLGCRTFFCGRRVGPAEPVAETRRVYDALAAVNIAADPTSAPRPIEAWLQNWE